MNMCEPFEKLDLSTRLNTNNLFQANLNNWFKCIGMTLCVIFALIYAINTRVSLCPG